MSDLICIIGTDGSGKTTLAEALVERMQVDGQKAERVWLGSDNYLMGPVRALLKLFWVRRKRGKKKDDGAAVQPKPGLASMRVDYAAEIARKNAIAERYGWAVQIYLALVWFDYWLQLTIKRFHLRNAGTIVADRYLFDVVVNLGLTLGWSPDEVVRYTMGRLARVQQPKVRVFLRVEPEVSMARKDDVFDIDYLRMRLSYYDAIAKAFGFTVRDGTMPIAENADWLQAEVAAEAARPYVMYVHSNNVDIGGADKVLSLMARHMRDEGRPEKGCRVGVALRLPTAILDSHAQAGVPVFLYPFERPQLSHGLWGVLRLILRAPCSLWFFWRLFGRERPDIVHVNDLYDFLPALAARFRGIAVIWHVRMIPTSKKVRSAFSWLLARLAAQTVFISQAVAQEFPGVPMARSVVVNDFSDAQLVETPLNLRPAPRPQPLPEGGRLVVMVGRVESWKGQDVFVKAVAGLSEGLRKAHVFALVGGPVPGKEAFFADVKQAAQGQGIHMLGARSDVPEILCSADISVHCSVTPEPLGAVVLESMLAGAATVATNHGGVPEIILSKAEGILLPPARPELLTQALVELLEAETPPRERYGEAARARVLHFVDKRRISEELYNLYIQALPQGRRTSHVIQTGKQHENQG